mgnify:CR=1 FL=1
MKAIKKIIIILLTLILIISVNSIKVNASEKIVFSVNNISDAEKGSNVTVILKGENLEEASPKPIGIKLDVFYDSNVLEYVSAEKGEAAGSAITLHENYTDEGRIRIGIVSFMDINKSGEMYLIQFKVKDNVNVSSSDIKLEIAEVSDSSGNEISCDVQNATITIKGNQNIEDQAGKQEEASNDDNSENDKTESNEQNSSEGNNNTEEKTEKQEDTTKKISITEQDKNITNLLKEDTNLDTEKELTWEVENPDILEIDESGNIIPKTEGTTNVIVRDENNEEEIVTIEIGDEVEENAESNNEKNILPIVLVIIAILTLAIIVFVILKKRKK